MSMPRRPWLAVASVIGLAALAVSLVSASRGRHLLSPSSSAEPPPSPGSGGGVRCLGTVDVEGGLIPLAPVQAGEVVEIFVKEGQGVKKGDVLLRLDDTLARAKLAEAQGGVDEAQAALDQAKQGVAAYPSQVAAQKAKVEAQRKQRDAARAYVRHLEDLRSANQLNDADYQRARDTADALEAGVRGEEELLRALEANRPEALVKRAEGALARARALKDQAQYAVDKHTLKAPFDGTVLQVLVTTGAGFSPQHATQPAFWFRPAGSRLIVHANVEQEFAGRVAVDQPAQILDDSRTDLSWKGRVVRVPDVFLPKRTSSTSTIPLPMAMTETRVLECVIEVEPGPGPPPRVGQRVRLVIGP